MPLNLDAFIYDEHNPSALFPILCGFVRLEWVEYPSEDEWRETLAHYIQTNRPVFVGEVARYPSINLKIGCLSLMFGRDRNKTIEQFLKQPIITPEQYEAILENGTQRQITKMKLKFA